MSFVLAHFWCPNRCEIPEWKDMLNQAPEGHRISWTFYFFEPVTLCNRTFLWSRGHFIFFLFIVYGQQNILTYCSQIKFTQYTIISDTLTGIPARSEMNRGASGFLPNQSEKETEVLRQEKKWDSICCLKRKEKVL